MELYLAIKHVNPTLTDEDFMVLNDNQWEWDYIKWYNKEVKTTYSIRIRRCLG